MRGGVGQHGQRRGRAPLPLPLSADAHAVYRSVSSAWEAGVMRLAGVGLERRGEGHPTARGGRRAISPEERLGGAGSHGVVPAAARLGDCEEAAGTSLG